MMIKEMEVTIVQNVVKTDLSKLAFTIIIQAYK